MNKLDVALGLGWVLLGGWSMTSDAPLLLGVGMVVLGALYVLTAVSPQASAVLHKSVLRRK